MNDCKIENGRCDACGYNWSGDSNARRVCPASKIPRSEPQQAACLAVCAPCPNWDVVKCRLCHCLAKAPGGWAARLATGDCPEKKWPPREA